MHGINFSDERVSRKAREAEVVAVEAAHAALQNQVDWSAESTEPFFLAHRVQDFPRVDESGVAGGDQFVHFVERQASEQQVAEHLDARPRTQDLLSCSYLCLLVFRQERPDVLFRLVCRVARFEMYSESLRELGRDELESPELAEYRLCASSDWTERAGACL